MWRLKFFNSKQQTNSIGGATRLSVSIGIAILSLNDWQIGITSTPK